MHQEKLVNKRGDRREVLILASSLFLVLTSMYVHVGGGAEQCSTESTVGECTLEKDQAQAPLNQEHPINLIKSCASKEDGKGNIREVCEEIPNKADIDNGITSTSSDELMGQNVKSSEYSTTPQEPQYETLIQAQDSKEDSQFSVSSDLLLRSMQGLEDMLGQVEKSSVNVFEKLGDVIDQVGLSREQVMKSLDTVMDRVSESVSESKVRVIKSIDSLMDQVSASKTKMMEELDHVIDQVAHSKVMEDIRALPGEIRESVVLSVRNRSYIAAGIMVAITTAVLVAGAVYFAWCHDSWSYHCLSAEELTTHGDVVNTTTDDNNDAVLSNNTTDGVTILPNNHAVVRVHNDGVDNDGYKEDDNKPCSPSHGAIEHNTQEEWRRDKEGFQKFSHSEIIQQSSFTSFTPEAVDVCKTDDVFEAKLKGISEDNITHECEQENKSNTCEPWNIPQKLEHQDGSGDPDLDKDKSNILAPKDLFCSFECLSDLTLDSSAFQMSLSKGAHSGMIADSIWREDLAVHGSQSCQEHSRKPSAQVVRIIRSDTPSTGVNIGGEDVHHRCLLSSVDFFEPDVNGCSGAVQNRGDESIRI